MLSDVGILRYANESYEFEDRELAHVKAAIGAKLRRHESFYLSWNAASGGRVTLWMAPTSHIEFQFDDSTHPELNREWIEQLTRTSHSLRGMVISAEPETTELEAS